MYRSIAALCVAIATVFPAAAGEMKPEEAKHFVAGKLFSYTCFEGSTGMGRIFADGSVFGTIRIGGTGPVRYVSMPAGTVRATPDGVCASVRGMLFEPCFNLEKTSQVSFRGSIAGLSFAYCDFTRRNARLDLTAANTLRPRTIQSSSRATPTNE
ncbi:MAG: hypothetical protein J2P54_07285 [Bradyrhizobiaceae bacterium]|nr:hypothetical protein [Bradyrhizobiaceae bacterium]